MRDYFKFLIGRDGTQAPEFPTTLKPAEFNDEPVGVCGGLPHCSACSNAYLPGLGCRTRAHLFNPETAR